jgi:CBS domain-containing protein
MKIKECMKKDAISISMETSISEAAAVIVEKHIGILPVLDEKGKPVGVLRLGDLLSLEMPDFLDLVDDLDFVHDFGAVETTRPAQKLLHQPVTAIMEPVMTIEEESGLLRAFAMMLKNNLYDLPVTNARGELVGIVSRVDIGTAVLSLWSAEQKA